MEQDKAVRKQAHIGSTIWNSLKLAKEAGNIKELVLTNVWLFTGGLMALVAIFEKNFLNSVAKVISGDLSTAFANTIKWLVIWGGAVLFTNFLQYLSSSAQIRMWRKMNNHIQEMLIRKVARIQTSYFDNRDTYQRFEWVKTQLSEKLAEIISATFSTISNIIALVTAAIVISTDNWKIAIIIILGSIPAVLISRMQTEENYYNEQYSSQEIQYQTYISWVMFKRPYMKEMRFGYLYDYIRDKFEESVMLLHKKRVALTKKYGIATGGAQFFSYLTLGISLAMISYDIYLGRVGIGSFVLVYSSCQRMQSAFRAVFNNLICIGSDGRFIEDYKEIMNYTEEPYRDDQLSSQDEPLFFKSGIVTKIPRPVVTPNNKADIEFQNVTFHYPGTDRKVLDDISITITHGEKIAIVGENGSGKSTFIALLCGLYHPDQGEIIFGKKNIKDGIANLRAQISCTFQDFGQYEMTVADNVRIGDTHGEYSDTQVINALKLAGAWEFVKDLKDGINTHLGNQKYGGTQLSGGQWQKIAMARALIKQHAQVLILDEPTAALDPVSEAQLYRNFPKLAEDKTVILISHRLGATRLAERILVFHEGRIVEEGKHEYLMGLNGLYAEMYRAQAQWYIA